MMEWLPTAPAYGRFWVDIPVRSDRLRKIIPLGICRTHSQAKLKLIGHIERAGINSEAVLQQMIAPATTFRKQAAWWLAEIEAGRIRHGKKRTVLRPHTIDSYRTAVRYLYGKLGDKSLASIGNAEVKALVAEMEAETKQKGDAEVRRFSPKTIVNYFFVVTAVIASAVSRDGEPLFPRKWNLAYICLPVVDPKMQHAPTLTGEEITQILALAKGSYRVLYALLAGTGLRISEALGLEVAKHFSTGFSVIYVRQQRAKKRAAVEACLKTDSGLRDIDLHPSLAALLREYISGRKDGLLFSSNRGESLALTSVYRHSLKKIVDALGRRGVRFHAFRRFRESVLQRSEARDLLIHFWMGHADREMSSRYGKQLIEDVQFRQQWAEKVGLGFTLPVEQPSVWQVG
jgi:integrase